MLAYASILPFYFDSLISSDSVNRSVSKLSATASRTGMWHLSDSCLPVSVPLQIRTKRHTDPVFLHISPELYFLLCIVPDAFIHLFTNLRTRSSDRCSCLHSAPSKACVCQDCSSSVLLLLAPRFHPPFFGTAWKTDPPFTQRFADHYPATAYSYSGTVCAHSPFIRAWYPSVVMSSQLPTLPSMTVLAGPLSSCSCHTYLA